MGRIKKTPLTVTKRTKIVNLYKVEFSVEFSIYPRTLNKFEDKWKQGCSSGCQ